MINNEIIKDDHIYLLNLKYNLMTKIRISVITLMFVMILSTSIQSSTNVYAISVTPTSIATDIKDALLAGGGSGIDPSSVVVTISASSGAVGT